MVVSDAINDTRFVDNPLVTQEPYLRFYAGAPMKTPEGHNLGTLCVIEQVPRELTQNQMNSVQALSHQVMAQMELRRQLIERNILLKRLKNAVKEVRTLSGLLHIWAKGKVIRNEIEEWLPLETYIRDRSHAEFTHGICPSCKQDLFSQLKDYSS
jgi:GAF domain-containing protein